jgi:hypothetical protein
MIHVEEGLYVVIIPWFGYVNEWNHWIFQSGKPCPRQNEIKHLPQLQNWYIVAVVTCQPVWFKLLEMLCENSLVCVSTIQATDTYRTVLNSKHRVSLSWYE